MTFGPKLLGGDGPHFGQAMDMKFPLSEKGINSLPERGRVALEERPEKQGSTLPERIPGGLQWDTGVQREKAL